MLNKRLRIAGLLLIALFLLLTTPLSTPAQERVQVDNSVFENLSWRSIGPAAMGGRMTQVEGIPGDPNIVYAASAAGGLWKTTNGGVTWAPIFDHQDVISIGAIAVQPGNPDVVWVGTGEGNPRNTASFGDGVYRTTDGGKTWQHLGLMDTERITRIIVNPKNPDNAYVAALGHFAGQNEERGVFMTTDGGKTWQKVLYLDPSHGAADMDMDPSNPNILFATMYHFLRRPWMSESGDEKDGVFKSVDGGRTWKQVTKGLPKLIGRSGVRVAPSNSNVVYVIAQSNEGILFRSDDAGETFHKVSEEKKLVGRGLYYAQVRVDPQNENRVYAIALALFVSIDGGHKFQRISARIHGDHHTLWIDPQNTKRLWQGNDGGLAVSYDRAETWEFVNNIPLGQPYVVHADNREPFYWITGGLQDNGTWTGPSRTREPAGILNDDWKMISFGDGFHVVNKPDDPDIYVSEYQGGGIVRTDRRTREQQDNSPQPRRNDGGPVEVLKYRFNWNAPIVESPHDPNTIYFGGNVLFKSTDFGKTWKAIRPDLTTNNPEKLKSSGGPVWSEDTTAEYHCSILTVSESPLRAGMIWVGTDDGNLQLTTDNGKTWRNLIGNFKSLAPNSPVTHIEASRTDANSAYATFDRHHFDDFHPYIFKTADGGKSWTSITGNLPEKDYVWVIREDLKNSKILYAGTELGLYISYDGGNHWFRLAMKNMPAVAVRDVTVQTRENDLVVATHGRSFWIFDDASAIQEMSPELLASSAHLFEMRPALRFASRFTKYGIGDKVFRGPNPPAGALITYYLKDKLGEKETPKIQILDTKGKVIREIKKIPSEKGVNRVAWDMKTEGPELRRPPTEDEMAEEDFEGPPGGALVLPGTYTVKLIVGDKSSEQKVEVRMDPTIRVSAEDLQQQFEYAQKLRDMQSTTNQALRYLDTVKGQLEQLQKDVKTLTPDPPAELTKLLADRRKQVETLLDPLARRDNIPAYGEGPQLIERISGLFSNIEGTDAAPTAPQMQYFTELRSEFEGEVAKVNKFISEDVPKLNETLKGFHVSGVMPGKPLEMPR